MLIAQIIWNIKFLIINALSMFVIAYSYIMVTLYNSIFKKNSCQENKPNKSAALLYTSQVKRSLKDTNDKNNL